MVLDSLKPAYDAVLKDLETERTEVHQNVAQLQRKLRELDYNIASLSRRLGIVPEFPSLNGHQNQLQSSMAEARKYATTSILWAILLELNKPNGNPMSAQEIADALQSGGIKTRSADFTNTVSATLSGMKKNKGEVELVDGKWFVTDAGKSHADHIANKLRRARSRSERIEAPEF